MSEIIFILIIIGLVVIGAATGFGTVWIWFQKKAAFIFSGITFVISLIIGIISVFAMVFGTLAGIADAAVVGPSNNGNQAAFLIFGGVLVCAAGIFLFGASLGALIGAFVKKSSTPQT